MSCLGPPFIGRALALGHALLNVDDQIDAPGRSWAVLRELRDRTMDYDALAASTEAAVDRAHKLAGELRDTEAALSFSTCPFSGALRRPGDRS